MKLFGNLLLLVCVITGALSATTAYHVPLTLPDESFQDAGKDLTIKSHAGVVLVKDDSPVKRKQRDHYRLLQWEAATVPTFAGSSGRALGAGLLALVEERDSTTVERALGISRINTKDLFLAKLEWLDQEKSEALVLLKTGIPIPLLKKKDKLTKDLVKELRRQTEIDDPRIRQYYVSVQEFSLARWPYGWLFGLSVVGLLVGAVLLRLAEKITVTNSDPATATETPEAALLGLQQTLQQLRADLETLQPRQALPLILERLSEVQQTHMEEFIAARPGLVARMGLGGYAELMDHYAACERQINRAWSAAADDVYDEATACVDTALELAEATLANLKGTVPNS